MKRLLLLTALAALAALPLHAAEDGAISLSPAVITLRGDYGQSTTQTLRLVNGTSRPFSFDLVAQDVIVRDGKRLFADAGTVPGSVAATAVFSQKHVDVLPGETAAVTVTVTLPPSTPVRAVVALFRGTNHVMSGNVPMSASLGTLLTFTVSHSIDMGAEPLQLQPQSATANLAAAHACTNRGDEPLVAKGVLAVLDAQGNLVGKAAIKPHRLLPGESARLGTEYGGELAPGRYRVLVTYDYEGHTLTRSADVVVQ
jgi:hypothetical protein